MELCKTVVDVLTGVTTLFWLVLSSFTNVSVSKLALSSSSVANSSLLSSLSMLIAVVETYKTSIRCYLYETLLQKTLFQLHIQSK